MTVPKPLWVLAGSLAFWPCYSHSDPFTYGSTNNAAANGLSWEMTGAVLGISGVPGIDVSGVLYRYTAVKDPDDPMLVHVQNESADGNGYVFRETDNWSGLPGNTINKFVPVELTPLTNWGQGSIQVDGEGEVTNASVIYTFRVDECFDPQSSPSCDGYIDPNMFTLDQASYDYYNALDDDAVRNALAATDPELYEEEEEDESVEDAEEEAIKDDFEKGLSAAQNALTMANAVSQAAVISAMNSTANIQSYYSVTIQGGVYIERQQLVDSELPENPKGLRNGLAQQLKHEEMIQMQYKNFKF